MKQLMILAVVCVLAVPAMADTFGSGASQFTLDFVPISANPGETRSTNTSGGTVQTFTNGTVGLWTDPGYNYRMGKYEITNAQFAEFAVNNPYWTGADRPSNNVSWFEAAQFVNWLNTEHGHQEAYNFSGGTFSLWDASDAWGGTNLYRHKDAYYFLPTEDEWVKAAYWNGSNLQTWATINDTQPVVCVDAIYGLGLMDVGPWNVGSGSEELNGTFDMMGNVWEWMESPHYTGDYTSGSRRGIRGGSYTGYDVFYLASSTRGNSIPDIRSYYFGFRVASVPEPASLALLGIGGLALRYRKR